eukprot:5424750-Pleurochrysis_carterae.AAC.1
MPPSARAGMRKRVPTSIGSVAFDTSSALATAPDTAALASTSQLPASTPCASAPLGSSCSSSLSS